MKKLDITKIELRDFTDADWLGLSGAEQPAQGEPKIGTITVDGQEAQIAVDRNGVEIVLDDGRSYGLALIHIAALAFVEHVLSSEMSLNQLRALGFEQQVG